jgi:hypothetical protein
MLEQTYNRYTTCHDTLARLHALARALLPLRSAEATLYRTDIGPIKPPLASATPRIVEWHWEPMRQLFIRDAPLFTKQNTLSCRRPMASSRLHFGQQDSHFFGLRPLGPRFSLIFRVRVRCSFTRASPRRYSFSRSSSGRSHLNPRVNKLSGHPQASHCLLTGPH